MSEMPPSVDRIVSARKPLPEGQRRVSVLLGIGIFLLPWIFAWFLLRKGHSTLSRVIGFIWLALIVLVTFAPKAPDGAPPSKVAPAAVALSPEEIAKAEKEAKAEADAAAAAAAEKDVRRHPERSLSFATISGQKGGFETVLVLNGSIKNSSNFAMKDADIKCTLTGPSGTVVGSVRQTLYEIIPARQSKRFRELNMGFMGSTQVANFNCEIVDATLVTE